MKKLNLDEIKKISLDVLSEIDLICRENNFTYSLAYGTLIGAVRHKGFIPWDDDIDIMMPRKDYEKFIEYCKTNKTSFCLASGETDPSFGYFFAKACETENTTVITNNLKWQNGGVQVDIFPIDNLGNSEKNARIKFEKCRLQRELLIAWNWKKYVPSHKPVLREIIKFIFYIMSRFVSNTVLLKSIKKEYANDKLDGCEYVGIVCGAYRSKEIMHKSIYENYIDIQFEDRIFRSIENYNEYLKKIYGDYMKLPPEEKRITHHSFIAYWKCKGE